MEVPGTVVRDLVLEQFGEVSVSIYVVTCIEARYFSPRIVSTFLRESDAEDLADECNEWLKKHKLHKDDAPKYTTPLASGSLTVFPPGSQLGPSLLGGSVGSGMIAIQHIPAGGVVSGYLSTGPAPTPKKVPKNPHDPEFVHMAYRLYSYQIEKTVLLTR